ncbi:MAG: hypothetical protein IK114_14120 [Fibrobacter sp.]|nr:hypothetical protein [Fibrobacter sp.]
MEFIIPTLKLAYGRENAVYNQQIADSCPLELKPGPARIRKIINHIRQNDLVPCLIASSKGYYIAETEDELKEYEDSLRGRAEAIMGVCESIERQRKYRFGGPFQGRLF